MSVCDHGALDVAARLRIALLVLDVEVHLVVVLTTGVNRHTLGWWTTPFVILNACKRVGLNFCSVRALDAFFLNM